MNKQISPQELARTLQDFEKESAKMGMSEEMSKYDYRGWCLFLLCIKI